MSTSSHFGAQRALSAAGLRHQLRTRGSARLRIHGRSMWPVLRPGGTVTLRPAEPGEDLRGALIALEAGERVVVHRVESAADGQLATHGIARRHPDPLFPEAALIGVVKGLRRLPIGERPLRQIASAATTLIRAQRRVRGLG